MNLRERNGIVDEYAEDAETIEQGQMETAREFEARAFLELTDRPPTQAPELVTIACSDTADAEAMAVRSTLCQAAIQLLSRARRGRVVLAVRQQAPAARPILKLAQQLNEKLATQYIRVDVTTRPC